MEEITLRSLSGHETRAPATVWLKCLIEMLPSAQVVELVTRVQDFQAAHLIASPEPRHYRMHAEPGRLGVRFP